MQHRSRLTQLITFTTLASVAACAPVPVLGPEEFVPAQRAEDPAPEPSALDSELKAGVEFLGADSPEIREAIETYERTGKAPIIKHRRAGFVTFPFGQTQPILYCKPLRVCEVELQAGERVLDVALGDAVRWQAQKMESGPSSARAPHVVLKPTDFDISTNLVITTDRRVYHLGLISTREEGGGYYRSARYYYPEEIVARWTAEARREQDREHAESERVVASGPQVSPDELYFGYRISGDTTPWRPVRAFDDGTRVFIQMPPSMNVTEAPALFVLTEKGDDALVNYRLRGHYFVVDKLFQRAALVLGVGRSQRRVLVTRLPRGES